MLVLLTQNELSLLVDITAPLIFEESRVLHAKLLSQLQQAQDPQQQALVRAYVAGVNHLLSDEIEVDDEPIISCSDDGAWVNAWLWVPNDSLGICRECGEPGADNGEGWDGLCGSCADRKEP